MKQYCVVHPNKQAQYTRTSWVNVTDIVPICDVCQRWMFQAGLTRILNIQKINVTEHKEIPMNADIKQKIYDLLINWTKSKEIFTAFDVTGYLRVDGLWVEHSEVRNEVHTFFNNGGAIEYTRVARFLKKIEKFTWIYYPSNMSPVNYYEVSESEIKTDEIILDGIDIKDDVEVSAVDINDDVKSVKWSYGHGPKRIGADQRLRVPLSVLKLAGLVDKCIAIIPSKVKGVELVSINMASKHANDFFIYEFDKDGSIRFSPRKYGMLESEFFIEVHPIGNLNVKIYP